MKTRMNTLAAAVLLAGAAFAGQASAATIDFNGAEFELSVAAGAEAGHWDVTYTVDFSGYTGSDTSMTHIAWRLAGLKIASVDPGDATNGLNENGCGAAIANAAWACLDLDPDESTGTSDPLSWVFDVVFQDGGVPTLAQLAGHDFSIKARFEPNGLMSCHDEGGVVGGDDCSGGGNEVPVPGTLGLLGLGLAGLGLVRRRKHA